MTVNAETAVFWYCLPTHCPIVHRNLYACDTGRPENQRHDHKRKGDDGEAGQNGELEIQAELGYLGDGLDFTGAIPAETGRGHQGACASYLTDLQQCRFVGTKNRHTQSEFLCLEFRYQRVRQHQGVAGGVLAGVAAGRVWCLWLTCHC